MADDGKEDSVVVQSLAPGAVVIVHLPYKSKAAVSLDNGIIDGSGFGFDRLMLRSYVNLESGQPFIKQVVSINNEPVESAFGVEVDLHHSETTTYHAEGWCARMVNGKLLPYSCVWTYDTRHGVTGDPEGEVNYIIYTSVRPSLPARISWLKPGGEEY